MKSKCFLLFLIIGLSYTGFGQETVGGVPVDKPSVTAKKPSDANYEYKVSINDGMIKVEITKNGVLYFTETRIPGTNQTFKNKSIAEQLAKAIIKKLKKGEALSFTKEEISSFQN